MSGKVVPSPTTDEDEKDTFSTHALFDRCRVWRSRKQETRPSLGIFLSRQCFSRNDFSLPTRWIFPFRTRETYERREIGW